MRKLFAMLISVTSLLFAGVAAVSCDDPFDNINSEINTGGGQRPGKEDFPGSKKYQTKAKARYFGDKYSEYSDKVDNYVLSLYIGQYNQDGEFVDLGTELTIDLLCPKSNEMKLASGTYTCTTDNVSPFHFLDGTQEGETVYPTYFYRQWSSNDNLIELVKSGTITISRDGSEYKIVAQFKTNNNSYKWSYEGDVEFVDERASEVPADVRIDRFSNATVQNLGQIFEADGQLLPVDTWQLVLYGENYDIDKEYITMELLTRPASKSIEQGLYNFFITPDTLPKDYKPGSVIAGYSEETTPFGTWYCKGGIAYYAAQEGNVSVTYKDDLYYLNFDLTDTDEQYGGHFSGSYIGKLQTPAVAASLSLTTVRQSRSSESTRASVDTVSPVHRKLPGQRLMRNAAAARRVSR